MARASGPTHHMHRHCNAPAPAPAAVAPAGRALDAAEHLLVKCRPLESHWGLERFGLADASVLQALEVGGGIRGQSRVPRGRTGRQGSPAASSCVPPCAVPPRSPWPHPAASLHVCLQLRPACSQGLPGLELCPAYRLVDERLGGGWVAETRRLNAELAARGKQEVRRRAAGGRP